jgi:membrane associated rhomboid family serine protease
MSGQAREPASDFDVVVRWLALLWVAFVVDVLLRATCHIDLRLLLGLRPRDPWGLIGIVCAPLLHGSIEHLLSNSVALLLLGLISCSYGRTLTGIAIGYGWAWSGMLAWLIGQGGTVHIGASGLVFALIGFLIANGLFRKGCLPIVIAIATLILYGAALWSILPGPSDGPLQPLSWEMHMGGFIGGILASWSVRRRRAV